MSGPALTTAPKEEGFAKMKLYFRCSSLSNSLETVPTLSEAETAGQRRERHRTKKTVDSAVQTCGHYTQLRGKMACTLISHGKGEDETWQTQDSACATVGAGGWGLGGGNVSVSQA